MESTFRDDWLKAIAHLSRTMQDRIIADITRWQLTGEIPEKMSAMRRALFYTFILQIDPTAKLEQPESVETQNSTSASTPPMPPKRHTAPPKPEKFRKPTPPAHPKDCPRGHPIPPPRW